MGRAFPATNQLTLRILQRMQRQLLNNQGELLPAYQPTCTYADTATECSSQTEEEVHTELWCPKCGQSDTHLLPIEPMYGLQMVAELIPCSYSTLKWTLSLNKHLFDEPRYRFSGTGRRYRLLTASEVKLCRELLVRSKRSL